MKILSIFNNKGGVGKTTYLFHIAHLAASRGAVVLMVDCDSQCNLTAYTLNDKSIEKAWEENGNSIYRAIELVARGIGDVRDRAPSKIRENLFLIPGDLFLSNFEDQLGDSWNGARGGSEPSLRTQSAIHRSILKAAEKVSAELVLVDLGPNLGALNRAVLGGSDFIIIPVSPDLFSIRGTENLGSKLVTWSEEWTQANGAWDGSGFEIPIGKPKFAGYVIQHHNIRDNAQGMTRGWQIFGNKLDGAVIKNIVDKLTPIGQVHPAKDGDYNLGKIPNLHSLIPYSLAARKPVYECTGTDGLKGAHITTARESRKYFNPMVDLILSL